MRSPHLLVAFALVSLVACRGKLLASAQLTGPGTAEGRFRSTGRKIALWADTDGKWTGPKSSRMDVRYDVDIVQNGTKIGSFVCGTQENGSSTVCGTHSDIMGKHDGDCEVSLDCALPEIPAGETVMRVRATTGPNVKLVRKMSLNVRE